MNIVRSSYLQLKCNWSFFIYELTREILVLYNVYHQLLLWHLIYLNS